MNKITVYSKPNCWQCMYAKQYLDDKGIEYEEINVFQDEEALNHIKTLGYQTMPVISINGEYHTGFRPDLLAKAGE